MGQFSWWRSLTLYLAVFSLVMSFSGWPAARIGVIVNAIILGMLVLGGSLGWFTE
jgi:hypothetical protein